MKTHINISNQLRQFILVGIILVISLSGTRFTANAQSVALGNDVDKINNAMVVQLRTHDFDILVPKVKKEELQALKDAKFNEMVYVLGEDAGYYFFMGANWEKQSVREVFELIDVNLTIQEPNADSFIVVANGEDSEFLLDYNDHVQHIYQNFVFDKQDNSMAINIIKE